MFRKCPWSDSRDVALNPHGRTVAAAAGDDAYYGLIDFEFWARKAVGEEAVAWLKENVHPLDLAFRLAEDHGVVLLNGGGFEAPEWSLRVSLANLSDDSYDSIARGVRTVARGYRQTHEAATAAARKR